MRIALRDARLLPCLAMGLIMGLAVIAAHPAGAQTDDPQDLYSATRERYIQQQSGPTTANLNHRRDKYLDQTKNTAGFWWSVWQKHQPYSKGVAYAARPVETDIPAEPGLANNSAYGRNVTQLIYGNKNNPAGRTAAEAITPSANILADEANYGQGNADANSRINGTAYPGQVSERETTPVNHTDVQSMLPTP
jgi:hypothetical protein